MSQSPSLSSAETFLHSYREACERFDALAIVDHFVLPCHVTSDTGASVLRSARIVSMSESALSPRVKQAQMRWALQDATAGVLYNFYALYTLVLTGGNLQIVAIAHDEIPQYRECVARLRHADHAG